MSKNYIRRKIRRLFKKAEERPTSVSSKSDFSNSTFAIDDRPQNDEAGDLSANVLQTCSFTIKVPGESRGENLKGRFRNTFHLLMESWCGEEREDIRNQTSNSVKYFRMFGHDS